MVIQLHIGAQRDEMNKQKPHPNVCPNYQLYGRYFSDRTETNVIIGRINPPPSLSPGWCLRFLFLFVHSVLINARTLRQSVRSLKPSPPPFRPSCPIFLLRPSQIWSGQSLVHSSTHVVCQGSLVRSPGKGGAYFFGLRARRLTSFPGRRMASWNQIYPARRQKRCAMRGRQRAKKLPAKLPAATDAISSWDSEASQV